MDEPLLSTVSKESKEGPSLPPWDSSVKRRPASGTPKKKREETKEETTNVSKNKSIILNVCLFILITEFCERLAYYGLSGSLIAFFVKKLNYDKVTASELNTLFTTLCYLTPLFGTLSSIASRITRKQFNCTLEYRHSKHRCVHERQVSWKVQNNSRRKHHICYRTLSLYMGCRSTSLRSRVLFTGFVSVRHSRKWLYQTVCGDTRCGSIRSERSRSS